MKKGFLSAGILVIGILGFLSGRVSARQVEGIYPDRAERCFESGIFVEGVDLGGLSFSEAKAAVLSRYDWGMKVSLGETVLEVQNLLEQKVESVLQEIYYGRYRLDLGQTGDAVRKEAERLKELLDQPAKEPFLSGYDKETGEFLFSEGSEGIAVDETELERELLRAMEERSFQEVVSVQAEAVEPEYTVEEVREEYQTLAVFQTTAAPDGNRDQNIALACQALNGVIVQPGEEFSFNGATGERSAEKGYLPATAYVGKEVVQEPGGGVCQVSSTLYNAVILAGLKSVERHPHTYEPSYVTPGEDATVSYGGPDFKFLNTSDSSVAILADFAGQELTISIYGVPVLAKGEEVRMVSWRASDGGKAWITDLVYYQDGEEVSRKRFHTSYYS